jgi:hypothetical protein
MQNPDEDPYEIKSLDNTERVIRYIYYVRNNLFHGNKEPGEQRDEYLVEASYTILSRLLEPWMNADLIEEWGGA